MSTDDRHDELAQLVEEFVARERRGDRPSIAEYVQSHPELAEDIEDVFPLLTAIESFRHDGDEHELPPGSEIGDYRLLRVLGRGGMGIVYEAEQKTLNRRVALKVLPHLSHLDPRTAERFRIEAQAASRLKHPRIVPVIGYGRHDGVHFYTMQYIEGRGLDELIDEVRSGDSVGAKHYRDAARIGLQAAEGLAHAHANGVLHRDVKPSNLLLDREHNVWIADFGLCKEEDSDDITRSGDVLGTFRYMAPERFGGTSDVRGDIYGLGVTLYELLTRRRAYEEEDRLALAARIAREPPPRPRTLDSAIPLDLETIVRKAMAHDPVQRYPTAAALVADLRAFLEGRPISARVPTMGYLLRSAITRHKTLAATVLVATLLLIASTVWYVLDLKEKEESARLRQYAAGIAAASAAQQAGDGIRAHALLMEAPVEFRNWEWRHLESRLDVALRSFESRPVRIQSIAYAPGGERFVATVDNEIWIYNDATGVVEQRLEQDAYPTCVRWSPRGDRIAVGTHSGFELWSWPAGERIYLDEENGRHWRLAFTSGGDHVVCGVMEGAVVVYDADGAGVTRRIPVPSRVFALDHDVETGKTVIGTGDGRVALYELATWEEIWSHKVTSVVIDFVGFLPGGRVGCASRDGTVLTWSVDDGRLLRAMPIGEQWTEFLSDPLGRRDLVFGGGRLHVFDPRDGSRIRTLSGRTPCSTGAVHPDGRRAVVGSVAGTIQEWYLGDGGDPSIFVGHMDDVASASFDSTGRRVASGGIGGVVRLWDADTGELTRTLFGAHGGLIVVRFSPDDRWLATGDWRGDICIWDLQTMELVRRWNAHSIVYGLAFDPSGGKLFSLGRDGAIAAWEAGSWVLAQRIEDALEKGASLAISHDGRWLAAGGQEGHVQLRRTGDLSRVHAFVAHDGVINGLAFSPDDAVLASVSVDQTLRLWDPVEGTKLREFTRQDPALNWTESGIKSVTFSPDGSRVVTGSFTGAIAIWDREAGLLLATLRHARSWVSEVAFSPDGRRLLTPYTNSKIRIWDTVPERERVERYERAAELRAAARPIVDALWNRASDLDAVVKTLEARADLEDALRESAIRLVHRRASSRDGLVDRMWRDLTPTVGDADRQEIALTLAQGLWRAIRHRGQVIDPRCDTLYALGLLRTGDHERCLRVFSRTEARTKELAPKLHAVDLAVASMAHAALEQTDEARAHLKRLEQLIEENPALGTERVRGFLEEARSAVPHSGK